MVSLMGKHIGALVRNLGMEIDLVILVGIVPTLVMILALTIRRYQVMKHNGD